MKTTASLTNSPIHLPEDNLWQWADEKRSARIRHARTLPGPLNPESLSRRMARGILARFHSLLGRG